MAFIKKGYDPNHKYSVYGFLLFSEPPTLSEVVKSAEWGGNRNIKNSEFRKYVPGSIPGHQEIKNWEKLKNPNEIIKDSTLLSKGNGRGMNRIVCVRIGKLI